MRSRRSRREPATSLARMSSCRTSASKMPDDRGTVDPVSNNFDPRWDDPADAQYTWNRGQGPYPRLYEDVMRAYAEGQRRAWDAVASPMAREHVIRFVDGWSYHRGPAFDAQASARLMQHQQRAAARRDAGGGI